MSIPYIKKSYERTKKVLKSKLDLEHLIIVVIQSKKGKDKTDKTLTDNVVYQIKCNDCNAQYVGETKTSFVVGLWLF